MRENESKSMVPWVKTGEFLWIPRELCITDLF